MRLAFLNRIDVGPPEPEALEVEASEKSVEARVVETRRSISLTLDVGRTAAIVLVALAVTAAAVILYSLGKNDAGRLFVDILVAVVSGGLGINFGERSGAKEVKEKLLDE